MVYANVPEHSDAQEPQPTKPRSTDQWLEQISGQLQDLVDVIQQAISEEDDPDEGGSADEGADSSSTAPDQGDGKDTTARKTAAAKRAEVKGD